MPKYGKRSTKILHTCHQDLITLFNEVIKYIDCSVLCGYRREEEQDEYFRTGRSEKEWPDSEHNVYPSLAVDVAPYFSNKPHIRWKDTDTFYFFGGIVFGIASQLKINIRWGGDWDRDKDLHDQNLFDLPHFEIII